MWTLVDAGLTTHTELKTMFIEDYVQAAEFLEAKREAERKAQKEQERSHRAGR